MTFKMSLFAAVLAKLSNDNFMVLLDISDPIFMAHVLWNISTKGGQYLQKIKFRSFFTADNCVEVVR